MTALDFSEVAVKRGLEMEPSVNWMVGDARRLDETFDEAAFGAIVDKGTVDAIYLSAGDSCTEDVGAVAAGAARVLEPRGTFLCVSLSAPQYTWPLLQCDAWDIQQCEVRRLDGAFLYVAAGAPKEEAQTDRATTRGVGVKSYCVQGVVLCPEVGVVTVVGESHRGDGCRSAVVAAGRKMIPVLRRRLEVGAVPVGVPSATTAAYNSDRYAIRTRNLQDWNLTRYRFANRSKAPQRGTPPRYVSSTTLGTPPASPPRGHRRGGGRHAAGRRRPRQFLLAGHRLGLGAATWRADCMTRVLLRARPGSAPAGCQLQRASGPKIYELLTLVFERTAATGRANSARMQGNTRQTRSHARSRWRKNASVQNELDRPQFELRSTQTQVHNKLPTPAARRKIDPRATKSATLLTPTKPLSSS